MEEKRAVFVSLVIALSVMTSAVGPCRAQVRLDDEAMKAEVVVPATPATLDDSLIERARAANINVLADATDFPEAAPLKPFPATPLYAGAPPTLRIVLEDLAQDQELSWLRYQSRTFLFWTRPDIPTLARKIPPASPNTSAPANPFRFTPEQTYTADLLAAYLRQAHGWDGRTNHLTLSVRLGDLPSQLRAHLLAKTRLAVFPPDLIAHRQHWLEDKSWEQARLFIQPSVGARDPVDLLMVGYRNERRGSLMSFATLPKAGGR